MPDDLYEHDVLVWSEKQAALLRQLSRGERVNEAVDWEHVIEEVGDVGLSQLSACQSYLRQAIVHLLKLHRQPEGQATGHWHSEIANFLADAQQRFSASMRQRIDLDVLYRRALRQLRVDGQALVAPDACPFTIDDLLDEDFAIDALLAKLR